MTEWIIEISDVRSVDSESRPRDALYEFNFATTGFRDVRPRSCVIYDEELVAGIDGFTWGGYARIDIFWVAETHRGRGCGSALLAAAESETRTRGCGTIVLDSHSFQAPQMYLHRGYVAVGTTTDTPRGFTQTLFQKSL